MPDAEPLAETIATAETDPTAPEIVDLTDAAPSDPPGTEPDTGSAEASATTEAPSLAEVPSPADRRDRLRKVGAIVFIAVVVLGAATVTVTRSPFFAARTIEVRGASH